MDARVGELLASKYRLEQLLGSGGMGHVYRAVNEHIGRVVAIKVLRSEHAQNPQIVERFLREARAANLVRHPNVVDVLDIGKEDGGAPFIVQELLEGEDLAHLVERRGGQLPVQEVFDILGPVIDAVAVAHHKGVVHRDIKPENVFLAKSGRGPAVPKLLDFGISKISAPDLRATEVGVMMGTPAYMAPEQIQGARDADPRSDVWAIGIMLFELIAGHMPFDAQDAPQLFVAIATRNAPSLLEARAPAPPRVSQIVERCLRRLPDDRYPTAAELARDIRHMLSGTELEPTGRHSIPPSMRERDTDLSIPEVPELAIPKAPLAPTRPGRAASDTAAGHGPFGDAAQQAAEVRATAVVDDDGRLSAPELPNQSAEATARQQAAMAVVPPDVSKADPELPKPPSLAPPAPRMVSKAPDLGAPPPPRPPRAPEPEVPALPVPPPGASRLGAALSGPPGAGARSAPAADSRSRLAPGAALSGVGLAPGPSTSVRRAGSHESWGMPPRDRADLSPIIGFAVVGLVTILGTGLLMRLAHRPEGWPVAAFALAPSPSVALVLHTILAAAATGVGATYGRRGIRHWRGDLSGGPSAAILNAGVAAGAFFCAIELASAVY